MSESGSMVHAFFVVMATITDARTQITTTGSVTKMPVLKILTVRKNNKECSHHNLAYVSGLGDSMTGVAALWFKYSII